MTPVILELIPDVKTVRNLEVYLLRIRIRMEDDNDYDITAWGHNGIFLSWILRDYIVILSYI